MRNDFYVGMYEDQYLAHGIKGWIKKGHKYISRFFKNGRWQYIYANTKNAMISRQSQENGNAYASLHNWEVANGFGNVTGMRTNNRANAIRSYKDAERYGRYAGYANAKWRGSTLGKLKKKSIQRAVDSFNKLVGKTYTVAPYTKREKKAAQAYVDISDKEAAGEKITNRDVKKWVRASKQLDRSNSDLKNWKKISKAKKANRKKAKTIKRRK